MARASLDKKAADVLVLHVAALTSVADYLVICSGESERQVRAIADSIDGTLSAQRHSPLSMEGASSAKWILMDFGDVVVHIFHSAVRDHYGLERLWSDAKRVRIPSSMPSPKAAERPRPARSRSSGLSRGA
ncbi:MAG TPA: ribosome silencing factor [Nitrospiraceae bacterium]|nr:ribosome silencing factor [Nitrospiraceae bacterium]